ncbi:hypothetical protein Gogos_006196, partial [Gossypium gossypioides]|nr:hypothetical protein [Gossypium gossypioides]
MVLLKDLDGAICIKGCNTLNPYPSPEQGYEALPNDRYISMERDLAVLSLDDEEEEIMHIQKELDSGMEEVEFCLTGTPEEYDGSNMGKGVRNYLRIRVQLDVRRPLRRKKK